MATPASSKILVAIGGRVLTQLGTVPWRKGLVTRGGEIPYTFTRADATTCATYIDYDGTIRLALANLLRIEWVDLDGDGIRETPGLSLEGTRTNVVLWNRDMTNAAWTKTTMTAAKDQIGMDGAANSASSLLATAGNATCLQAITLGSSQRAQAVWVKRLVGSGTINMTMDNGATWTVVTLTANWTRVTIPSQTLANPTVGFRIVTNADKIAVDYVQNENGAFESSAIAVTTVAITRAADSLTVPFNFGPFDTTVLARIARPVWADAAGDLGFSPGAWILGSGTIPNIRGGGVQAARQWYGYIDTATADSNFTTAILAGASQTIAWQFKNLATAGQVAADVGGGLGGFASAATAFSAYGGQTLRVGATGAGQEFYGVLIDLLIANGLYSLTDMLAVTL